MFHRLGYNQGTRSSFPLGFKLGLGKVRSTMEPGYSGLWFGCGMWVRVAVKDF